MADSTIQLGHGDIAISMINEQLDKVVDLTNTLVACDVIESVDKMSMQATLIIEDSEDLVGGWGMTGSEFITIQWKSPDQEIAAPEREHTFRIAELANIQPNSANTKKTVQMQLVSLLQWENAFTSINMVVEEPIHKAIEKIFQKLVDDGKQRGLKGLPEPVLDHSHKTQGKGRIVIPGMNPFEAIELLTARAINNSDMGKQEPMQYYAFYENKDGFHFRNMQAQMMLAESTFNSQKANYRYEYNPVTSAHGMSAASSDDKQLHFNPISIKQIRRSNMFQLAQTGGLGNMITKVDYLTKKVEQTMEMHGLYNYFYNLNLSDAFKEQYLTQKPTNSYENHMAYVDGSSDSDNIVESMSKKTAMMSLMYNNMMTMDVYGNSALTAGEVIYLLVNQAHNNMNELHVDEFMSGQFLIKDVVHRLRPGNVYKTSVVLTRPGHPEKKNEVNT